MTTRAAPTAPAPELDAIAAALERARGRRIRTGERIRTLLRGETPTAGEDRVLVEIRTGASHGPDPELGREYRESWTEERARALELSQRLAEHPAWEWLQRVSGVTPALAARLLSRLDPRRAGTPSAFWAYSGLATVAAADGGRTAQPVSHAGRRPGYDPQAKAACHEIAAALLRANGAYARHYREQRAELDASRPAWDSHRRHLTALRKTQKLFLAHLWLVWREALGLPLTEPHARDPNRHVGPWEMVRPSRRRWLRADRTPPRPSVRPR